MLGQALFFGDVLLIHPLSQKELIELSLALSESKEGIEAGKEIASHQNCHGPEQFGEEQIFPDPYPAKEEQKANIDINQ